MKQAIAKIFVFFFVFAKIRGTKSISLIVQALWRVRKVESYALSEFQPTATLGDPQNVKRTVQKKLHFFGSRKSVFRNFSWILEGIDNFERQNQFPCEILFQIHLFWGPCDQKLRKNDLCCENLASASPTCARPNLYVGGGCRPSSTNIKW